MRGSFLLTSMTNDGRELKMAFNTNRSVPGQQELYIINAYNNGIPFTQWRDTKFAGTVITDHCAR